MVTFENSENYLICLEMKKTRYLHTTNIYKCKHISYNDAQKTKSLTYKQH